MWLAFKIRPHGGSQWTSETRWHERLKEWWFGMDVRHVEIVLPVRCCAYEASSAAQGKAGKRGGAVATEAVKCAYCREWYKIRMRKSAGRRTETDAQPPPKNGCHWLSYSAVAPTGRDPHTGTQRSGVDIDVDRTFTPRNQWIFVRLPILESDRYMVSDKLACSSVELAAQFLNTQRRRGFNRAGYSCNFSVLRYVFCMGATFGLTRRQILESSPRDIRRLRDTLHLEHTAAVVLPPATAIKKMHVAVSIPEDDEDDDEDGDADGDADGDEGRRPPARPEAEKQDALSDDDSVEEAGQSVVMSLFGVFVSCFARRRTAATTDANAKVRTRHPKDLLRSRRNAWFCSELVAASLVYAGYDLAGWEPCRISPGNLLLTALKISGAQLGSKVE